MNSTDIVLLVILSLFAIRGFFRGLVQELFSLAGIFALIFFITSYVEKFQRFISQTITPVNYWLALILGMFLIIVATGLITILMQKLVCAWRLNMFDRILGFFLGFLFGGFFIFLFFQVFFHLAKAFHWTSLTNTLGSWINQSHLLQTLIAFLESFLSQGNGS